MKKDDVAALLIIGLAGREVIEHAGRDLLWGEQGLVAPIMRVDFVADGDVAQALSEFERLDLIFGVGLGVDGIGRTEKDGANAEAAGK